MFCMKCGLEITNQQANFCNRCGQKLGNIEKPISQNTDTIVKTQIIDQPVRKKRKNAKWIVVTAVILIAVLLSTWIALPYLKELPLLSFLSGKNISQVNEAELKIPVSKNGDNRLGNLAENANNGGLMSYQGGWTFYADPSRNGCMFAISDDNDEPVMLTDFPVANIGVMGDNIIFTDLSGTVLIKNDYQKKQYVRYPNGNLNLPSILSEVKADEEVVFGGCLYFISGVKEFSKMGDSKSLKMTSFDMDGSMCYYPVITPKGIFTSCLREGVIPMQENESYYNPDSCIKQLETFNLSNLEYEKTSNKGFASKSKPAFMNLSGESANSSNYQLLKKNGILQLARVEHNEEGSESPYKSVEFLTTIGDEKTKMTGFSPIIAKEDAIYVEVYQEPDTTEDGNWQQPSILVLDPKDHHVITKYKGSLPRSYGDDIYFLDEKGRLCTVNGSDPSPTRISRTPAISSFSILSNGDIAVTYYADDATEARQGLISRNSYDEVYKDSEPGSGSKTSGSGWYSHMNILDGMLEDKDKSIKNKHYYNDKDTFFMRKDENGYWSWYRLSKKDDGTFDMKPQKNMMLPDDKRLENERNALLPKEEPTPAPTPAPEASQGNDSGQQKTDEPAIQMNNPAMALIYDKMMPEPEKPCLSNEEVDKKWVLELKGEGTFTLVDSGYQDYDAYYKGCYNKYSDVCSGYGGEDQEKIINTFIEMEKSYVGQSARGEMSLNALPGFEKVEAKVEDFNKVSHKLSLSSVNMTLSYQMPSLDIEINSKPKSEDKFIIVQDSVAYCAYKSDESNAYAAFRLHFHHHKDGSIAIKGYYCQLNEDTSYEIIEIDLEVTESNISG